MAKEANPDPGVMYRGSKCCDTVTNSNLTLATTAHQSSHADTRQEELSVTRQDTAQVTLARDSRNRCSGRYWGRI